MVVSGSVNPIGSDAVLAETLATELPDGLDQSSRAMNQNTRPQKCGTMDLANTSTVEKSQAPLKKTETKTYIRGEKKELFRDLPDIEKNTPLK